MSVIPQTPRAYGDGGFVPLDPLLGLCPGPAGDLKRSPDPPPTHAPLIPNPGSAPVNSPLFSIFGTSPVLNARGTNHPRFSNFLFTNLFSIKFLYFLIISSLFPYFNLFVSIFKQSYVNIKLNVSTLYRY